MSKVIQSIPLDSNNGLYNIIDSLMTSNTQRFCPIQLEIANAALLKKECKESMKDGKPDEDTKRFLLQVWTLGGKLIYEYKMSRPVRGWYL